MRAIFLVLVCLACAGHGRRVQAPSEITPHSEGQNPSQSLAMLLLAFNPGYPLQGTGIRRSTPAITRNAIAGTSMVADLRISGKGTTVTDSMKDYAQEKISKALDRYSDMITGPVNLQLKVEQGAVHDTEHRGRETHIADITASLKGKKNVHVTAKSESMYASLDEVADKVSRQLRKSKEKNIDTKRAKDVDPSFETNEEPPPQEA